MSGPDSARPQRPASLLGVCAVLQPLIIWWYLISHLNNRVLSLVTDTTCLVLEGWSEGQGTKPLNHPRAQGRAPSPRRPSRGTGLRQTLTQYLLLKLFFLGSFLLIPFNINNLLLLLCIH